MYTVCSFASVLQHLLECIQFFYLNTPGGLGIGASTSEILKDRLFRRPHPETNSTGPLHKRLFTRNRQKSPFSWPVHENPLMTIIDITLAAEGRGLYTAYLNDRLVVVNPRPRSLPRLASSWTRATTTRPYSLLDMPDQPASP